tara:strand:+ start:107 stop:1054 length:948 start_codon:yes stop_codon:yes gene_type:complete
MENVAVITTFFSYAKNPLAIKRFYEFKNRLEKQGVKLFTVELAFKDEPYLLEEEHVYLRLRTDTVLWHKESLLNALVDRLPPFYDKIVWLDCDVEIEDDNWVEQVDKKLDEFPILQVGSQYLFQQKNGSYIPKKTVGHACQLPTEENPANYRDYHVGLAWAANRSFYKHVGMFDYDITGSGDTILFYSAANFWPTNFSWWLRNKYKNKCPSINDFLSKYIDKANKFFPSKQARQNIGCTETNVIHRYHGNYQRRGYVSRLALLDGLDMHNDLTRDSNNLFKWTNNDFNKRFEKFFLLKDKDSDEACEYDNINDIA